MAESTRHNLGSVTRTINIPTLAMMILHLRVRDRFAFTLEDLEPVAGVDADPLGEVVVVVNTTRFPRWVRLAFSAGASRARSMRSTMMRSWRLKRLPSLRPRRRRTDRRWRAQASEP